MKKKLTKITAIILCIVMLITEMPTASRAVQENNEDVVDEIICEAIEYRDEYTKAFRKADGTYVAISTGEALHYKDEAGEWQDIDNTLIAQKDDQGNDVITNTANDFSVELPATLDSNKQVTMEKGGYSISFRLLDNVKASKAHVTNHEEKKLSMAERKQAKNLAKLEKKSATTRYSDVVDNTDIAYDIQPEAIKESIILKNMPKKSVSYRYEIKAAGLSAKLLGDNRIEFYAKGKQAPEFTMPAPYMFDSAKDAAYSYGVGLTLEETGEGTYQVTYTPDMEWLQSKDRKYPVTVDPTISTKADTSKVLDMCAMDALSSEVNRTAHGMAIGNYRYGTRSADFKMLIKYNLPALPSGCRVTKANAYVYFNRTGNVPSATLFAKEVNANWSSQSVSYNVIMPYVGLVVDHIGSAQFDAWEKLDVTKIYQKWEEGENYGLYLDSRCPTSSTDAWSFILSSNHVDTRQHPYLEVEFTSVSGVDTRYDMHTIDVGRAGTAYINDFTGQLIATRNEMSFDGNKSPLNLSFFYDYSRSKDWLAFHEMSIKWDATYKYYTLQDENAVKRYFEKKEDKENNEEIWTENEDSGYQLQVKNKNAPADYAQVTLTFSDGRIGRFNSSGILTSVEDPSQGTSIVINRSATTLLDIKDGAGRKYGFTNNPANNRPASIDYYGNGNTVLRRTQMSYDTAGNLITVTYPDGKSVSYTYNASNRLTSMKDVDGYKIVFTYTAGSHPRISKVEEFASDGTAGDWMTLSYSGIFVIFTNSRGRIIYKQFNKQGHTTCTRDENGYVVLSTYGDQNGRHQLLGTSDILIPGENLYQIQDWCLGAGTSKWSSNKTLTSKSPVSIPGIPTYGALTGVTPDTTSYIKQRIYPKDASKFSKGETFTYGGWGQSYSALPINPEQTTRLRTFGMKIELPLEGTASGVNMVSSFDFNVYSLHWQYQKSSFTIPYDVPFFDILFSFDYQEGTASFTGAELQKQPLYYYTSGPNGDIIQTETPQDESAIPIDHSKTQEDDKGRIVESISPAGVGQAYQYDAFGNITLDAITNGRVSIETKKTYTANGNYLQSITDPLGSLTQYNYDPDLGTLGSVTDANGKTTSYTYDVMQRLTGVSKAVTGLLNGTALSNSYTYDGDRLKTISHNGFLYTFHYDKWGNLSTIAQGSQTLVSYTYNYNTANTPANNASRLLASVSYANGQSQSYTYDAKDRLIGVRFNGDTSDRYSYTYDVKGKLTEKRDFTSGILTKYSDEKIEEWNLAGTTLQHSYVKDGDQLIEKIGNKTQTYTYRSDNDGRPMSTAYEYTTGKTAATETRYDDLGRVTNQGVSVTGNGNHQQVYWMNYLYRELPNFHSSQQVYSVDYTFGSNASLFNNILSYSYDKTGNISSISKNNQTIHSYTYDEAGQLTRVNDAVLNKTITYQYDAGGNIRSKTEYAYTTGTLGNAVNTIAYTYGDNSWGDKLTSYNGKAITYDANGNPLSYDGWTYVWEGGRQLKRMSKDGSVTDYKYDDSGIRTSKTIDGLSTTYTTIDGRITSQTTNGSTTYYRYDADGQLLSLAYNGAEYFYVLNIQGDVIGLVDENGSLVVEYAYDAWGQITAISGTLANSVGQANPMRYRGYYWDAESGLYYVNSRYYSPEWGRFVNMDEQIDNGYDILGSNVYAYCLNNPTNMLDKDGYAPAYINEQHDNAIVNDRGKSYKMKDISLGFTSNVSANGCAIIAIYNVMLSYSSNVSFMGIKREMELKHPWIRFTAHKGISYWDVEMFLKSKFWLVRGAGANNMQQWNSIGEWAESVIILYKQPWGGGHFIAGIGQGYRWKGGSFKFYNAFYTINGVTKSIPSVLLNLKAYGATPVYIIGVKGKTFWWW